MSRIGRKPIPVPSGVKVHLVEGAVEVQGPKGALKTPVPLGVKVELADGVLHVAREADTKQFSALHGLARKLIANSVHGVTEGFKKELDIVGIGYKADLKGKSSVLFSLGYSHPIDFPIPPGITISVDKQTHLVVSGADKQQVGQIAANIRALHPPDPYKNKGIRYTGERLKKKVGKTGAK